MSIDSIKSVVAENTAATAAYINAGASWARRKTTCWVCQKDKPRSAGQTYYPARAGRSAVQLSAEGGPRAFVCFECRPMKRST